MKAVLGKSCLGCMLNLGCKVSSVCVREQGYRLRLYYEIVRLQCLVILMTYIFACILNILRGLLQGTSIDEDADISVLFLCMCPSY